MTHAELAQLLSDLPSYERAQARAAFGADWSPQSVAEQLLAGDFPRYALRDDAGKVVAAGGLFPLGDGVWDAWVFANREARRRANMKCLTGVCQEAVRWAFAHGARRVDAFHLANQPRVHRWLESLGLKRAQDLPRYGRSGEDFIRYEVTA